MFEEWGFLLAEIWILLALAGLVGLIAGWVIWGRRAAVPVDTTVADRLRADLEASKRAAVTKDKRIAELKTALAVQQRPTETVMPPTVEPIAEAPTVETLPQVARPAALDGPRNDLADDLTMIKGVGAKMEKLCNSLGFYHFDQIAAWTPDEAAWVDANLEGFKGRVSRDKWVAQARQLSGGDIAFSRARKP